MKPTTATLKDVAREAGFSVMTVSHVLNGNKLNHASPRSRELILAAAKRLNYRPNLNARQLVTRKSNVIGLLIDSMAPLFYRDVMMLLERLAFEHGYRLQVGLVHNSLESLQQYIDDFRGCGIDHVICLAHAYPEFGELVPKLLECFPHVVFMEQPLAATRFPVVAADHYANYHNATAFLLKHGFRRIFSLRSEYRDRAFFEGQRGMRDAYREAQTPFEEQFWWLCSSEWWDNRQAAWDELDRILPERPEVLMVGNDESMFWALRVLQERNIRVPEDLGLFSADLWLYGKAASPAFAGFDYNAPQLARHIMDRLLELLERKEQAVEENILDLIPARLVWGESCFAKSAGGVK